MTAAQPRDVSLELDQTVGVRRVRVQRVRVQRVL